MNSLVEKLNNNLDILKLHKIKNIYQGYIEYALKEKLSTIEILAYLFDEETTNKKATSLSIRTKIAGFPYVKTFEQFDFSFQKSIDLTVINDLRSMRFVHNAENVLLIGSPGVGKTHLSVALGVDVVRNNYSCYYINCHDLILDLSKAHQENRLSQRIKQFCRHKVLIIDEVGYLPINELGSNLFFQLISKRYEKSSIILSSNKSYGQWNEIFGSSAAAILDRLLHHSTTITIRGESYRIKDKKQFINYLNKNNTQ